MAESPTSGADGTSHAPEPLNLPVDDTATRVVRRAQPRGGKRPPRTQGKRKLVKKPHPVLKWVAFGLPVVVVFAAAIAYLALDQPIDFTIQHIVALTMGLAVLLISGGISAYLSWHHPKLRMVALTLTLALLAADAGVYYEIKHLNSNLHKGEGLSALTGRPAAILQPGTNQPLNILVMGDDTRACAGCKIDNQGGSGGSDTTILLHVSADRKWAIGVSIPRDSMISRPAGCKDGAGQTLDGSSYAMWNAAFSIGGYDCTIRQFESTTGLRLDHYVVVNFGSFKGMVDALGGVTVCIPQAWNDQAHGITMAAGTQKISGTQALDYVRERYGIGDGSDIGRTRRQQAFIGSMVGQVLSAGTLFNPVKIINFLDAATKGLTVDPGLSDVTALGRVAYSLRGIGISNIKFITVPIAADPRNPKARVVWSQPDAQKVWDALKHDRYLSADLLSTSISAGQPGAKPSASASPSSSASSSASPSSSPTTGATAEQLKQVGLCAPTSH